MSPKTADLCDAHEADARVLASLDRARTMPRQNRYVMVDAASARLFMIEDGTVTSAEIEAPGKFDVSSAEACLTKFGK